MSELALVMKTPVEQLIPAMLAWNNTELMAQVEATLKQYTREAFFCAAGSFAIFRP